MQSLYQVHPVVLVLRHVLEVLPESALWARDAVCLRISQDATTGKLQFLFITRHIRFSSVEGRGASSPRRTRNMSRSTAISDSSAGSTPRRAQGRPEM